MFILLSTSMTRIFKNYKAQKLFGDLYNDLPKGKQRKFGMEIRKESEKKMEGDGDEFYITEKDVAAIYDKVK